MFYDGFAAGLRGTAPAFLVSLARASARRFALDLRFGGPHIGA